MRDPVLQTVGLGMPWPTIDPFLFCVHHLDHYPRGDGRFGPAGGVSGRTIGNDFEGVDGWRMYHGSAVPGFPQHPHRGFETVTYVRRGHVDHSDSLGAAARFGRGDVQWLTAGRGIVHSEMFPLLDVADDNPLELFQIWLNLPSSDKLVDPHFTMLWDEEIPRIRTVEDGGGSAVATVIAGELRGATPLAPPPRSWAARADADVAIWHVAFSDGARFELPPARDARTVRTVYVFGGHGVEVGGTPVPAGTGAVVRCDEEVALHATRATDVLVLQGRPIGEPVAQYGPFVMNQRAEIEQAFADYRRTGFGGWPWPSDEPVHTELAAAGSGRFARHPDGRLELP